MGSYEDISECLIKARNQIAKIMAMQENLSPGRSNLQRLLDLRFHLFKVEQDIKLRRLCADDKIAQVLETLLTHSCRIFLESLNQLSLEPNSQNLLEEALNSYGVIENLVNYGKTTGQITCPDDFISSLEKKYPALMVEIRGQRPHFPYDTLGIPTPKLKEEVGKLVQQRGKITVEEIAKKFSLKPEQVIVILKELSDHEKIQTIHTKDKKSILSWEWASQKTISHLEKKKNVDISEIAKKLNIEEEDATKLAQSIEIQKMEKTIKELENKGVKSF
jgi:Mn-dependent DtxR family transcriptional regulator